MNLLVNIVFIIIGVLFSSIAIIGETYKDGKITSKGKVAISLLIFTISIGIVKEYISNEDKNKEANQQIEQKERLVAVHKGLEIANSKNADTVDGINRIVKYIDLMLFNVNSNTINCAGVIEELKNLKNELEKLKTNSALAPISGISFSTGSVNKVENIPIQPSARPKYSQPGGNTDVNPGSEPIIDRQLIQDNGQRATVGTNISVTPGGRLGPPSITDIQAR